jgi:dipeptidyl aminopeptidase/acylaminoacyl peptidase
MSAARFSIAFAALVCTLPVAQSQQAPRVYTDADYAQAEKFMSYNVNSLVYHAVERPNWLPDGRFWYRDTGPKGITTMLVDPAKGTKAPAFDHAKLAAALQPLSRNGNPINPYWIPLGTQWQLSNNDQTVTLTFQNKRVACDLSGEGVCTPAPLAAPAPPRDHEPMVASPDGTKSVFIRDWNLWLRDAGTGKETQLTTDGQPNYGYATDNAGWQHSDKAIVAWSPDSKHIATFQQDQRKTGELFLVPVTNRHPELTTLKYPLVGDADVTMIERVVIDLTNSAKPGLVRLKIPPDQHRGSLCDDIACRGGDWEDVQWGADSNSLAFLSTSRDHKQEWFRIANPKTGEVRDIYAETAPKFFESGNGKVNWHYLSKTNELLWFSEKSNWGHLYLYDATTGKLKNVITSGDWNVTRVLGVDEASRTIFFEGLGREPGVDPYYRQYYRVAFDGTGLELLTPEKLDNVITPSPDNRFFVDTFSTPTKPQTTVVRDAHGTILVNVAHEDIAKLTAVGWIPPVEIEVKARDGVTDLYGFLFRPTNFSTDKKYPIIDYVYPGPQTGSCGDRTFQPARRDSQALAELGFIVVCIDGMGTPGRSKSFHETWATDLGDNTIPDQVTGLKQLAERYPWIDLNHVGIWGHSGGGNATVAAMFHYPDFFKVGIAESGNHDNREYEDDWAEKWAGLEVIGPDGGSNYDSQANQNFAKNLKGHLLLAHGTMDDNVPLNQTLLVVDALIKANKDFDLIIIPNARHGYGDNANYMMRRRWDYFVRYLAGGTPPEQYKMHEDTTPRPGAPGPSDADSEPDDR